MIRVTKPNWRYSLILPLFFSAYVTVFLKYNNIFLLNSEALISYFIFIAFGFLISLIMVFGGSILQVLISALIAFLFIFNLVYEYLVQLLWTENLYILGIFFLSLQMFFYLIHTHLDKFLNLIFGIFFVGSFFNPMRPFLSKQDFLNITAKKSLRPPPYVQIILDEHIGIEGIENLKFSRDLKNKYIQRGFKIYGRTYSRYLNTMYSFSSFLNLRPLDDPKKYLLQSGTNQIITKNDLFQNLAKQGYEINVIQSSYLDLCKFEENYFIKSCITYRQNMAVPIDPLLGTIKKSKPIISGVIQSWKLDNIFKALRVSSILKESSILNALRLSGKYEVEIITSPTASYKAFDEVINALKNIKRGESYFIHLLFPHRPYIYNNKCEYVGFRGVNSDVYVEQIECIHNLLNKLFQIIDENPIMKDGLVIIHGDHGSRIQTTLESSLLIKSQYGQFLAKDYMQTFSTFFAVRGSKFRPGYDRTPLPLEFALKSIVFGREPLPVHNKDMDFIYLAGGSLYLNRYPMQPFSKGQSKKSW